MKIDRDKKKDKKKTQKSVVRAERDERTMNQVEIKSKESTRKSEIKRKSKSI